jgi:hypothetical protein
MSAYNGMTAATSEISLLYKTEWGGLTAKLLRG